MARAITAEQKAQIVRLYGEGYSYAEIIERMHTTSSTISKLVRGTRSISAAIRLARSKGRAILGEQGRAALSALGKRAAARSGKSWTRPERQFMDLLNGLGIGVRVPAAIVERYGVTSDDTGDVAFQYPIQRYLCDFVDLARRVVYRIQGDFWHANPVLYADDQLTAIQRHHRRHDAAGRAFMERRGWRVCDVWESEFRWNVGLVRSRILASRAESVSPATEAPADWSVELKGLWFKPHRAKAPSCVGTCAACGGEFGISSNNRRARHRKYCGPRCAALAARKVERPTEAQLRVDLATLTWSAVGRKYGVSDNAVRKWARLYGLPPNVNVGGRGGATGLLDTT